MTAQTDINVTKHKTWKHKINETQIQIHKTDIYKQQQC